jgi:hypothetical protein
VAEPAATPATTATPAPDTTAANAARIPSSPTARPAPAIDRLLEGVRTTITTSRPATPSSPPEPPAPGPSTPAAPAPHPFTANGQLLAPDLLGRLGIGLTNRGPVGGCGPSSGQGLDAWVFELPADAPGAGAPVKATGSDLLGLHNLAVVFLTGDCEIVGQLDTGAADEAGVLPARTRFVVVSDRSGIGTAISLSVG